MLQEGKQDHRTLRVHPSELEVLSSCVYCPRARYKQTALRSIMLNISITITNKSKLKLKVTSLGRF